MAEARQRAEWDRTALLAAVVVNMHRDPRRGRPANPKDFHPLAEGSTKREQMGTFDELKRELGGNKRRG